MAWSAMAARMRVMHARGHAPQARQTATDSSFSARYRRAHFACRQYSVRRSESQSASSSLAHKTLASWRPKPVAAVATRRTRARDGCCTAHGHVHFSQRRRSRKAATAVLERGARVVLAGAWQFSGLSWKMMNARTTTTTTIHRRRAATHQPSHRHGKDVTANTTKHTVRVIVLRACLESKLHL